MDVLKKPSILEANIVYMVLGFALLTLGSLVQAREIYSGLLITEYIIILLPNILFLKIMGYSLKDVLRLNMISIKQIIYTILIMIFAYPVAVFLNMIVMTIVNAFSSAIPTTVPLPTNFNEYVLGLFVIALGPGICEEVMFRGTMMKAYDGLGYKKSIVITAILFGLFHFNIMNLIGPTFLGIVLGILVHKSNSLFSSIIGHTINNGLALSLGYGLSNYSSKIDEMVAVDNIIPEKTQMIFTLILFGLMALFCFSILLFLLRKFPVTKSTILIEDSVVHTGKYNTIKYTPVFIIIITFLVLNSILLFFPV